MSKARGGSAVDQLIKLVVGAGQASPSPPVGPALGSKGVKSMDFCKVCFTYRSLHANYLGEDLEEMGRMCSHVCMLTVRPGVQCKNITHQPRHADARPCHRPPRPNIPLRCADTTDVMATAQCSGGDENQEREKERRREAGPRGRRDGQPEACL